MVVFLRVERFPLLGDSMGEVRLWPLDTICALREAVVRLCFGEEEVTVKA